MLQGLTHRPALLVRFPASWDHIDPIRQYVEVCTQVFSKAVAERACMVTQELLENAVRYGDRAHEVEFQVDLAPPEMVRGVELRVSNRAHPSRIAVLESEFARIGGSHQDSFAKALERAKRLPQGSSMLGLPRIATEATLKLEVTQDRVLIIARIV